MRTLLAVVALAAAVTACGMNMNQLKGATAAPATKKDCAACEKMCSVAADAEKNPDAL